MQTHPQHPYDLRAHSSKALLQRLYRDGSSLIGDEVALAKIEARERRAPASRALGGFVAASIFGLVGAACVAAAVVTLLGVVIALWLAELLVGTVLIVAAFAVAGVARGLVARAAAPLRSALGSLLNPPSRSDETEPVLRSRIEVKRRQVRETVAALERKTDLVAPIKETVFGLGSLGVAVSAIVRAGNENGRRN
jgi:hypothetical protein